MAGASDSLDFAEEVGFGFIVVAVVPVAQLLHFGTVGCTQVFSYNFLCYVTTNIFSVVALLFDLFLLLLRLEDFRTLILILIDRIEWEK